MTEASERPRGTLYLVGTPIGNLEDVTMRALRVLREVAVIAAEDTRQTRKLLDHYGIQKPLVSYFEHNERARVAALVERLQREDVALVSDAGMPGVSDPGYDLVRAAIEAGVRVVPIPGPSAPIAAIAASGLPTDQFIYLGFLPRRSTERRRFLSTVKSSPSTLVAFESPHRLESTLVDALAELGDRPVVVARELTKIHEEFVRGQLSEVIRHFQANPPRGEITLVLSGARESEQVVDVTGRVAELAKTAQPTAQAAAELARQTGISRREAYRLLLGARNCAKMEARTCPPPDMLR